MLEAQHHEGLVLGVGGLTWLMDMLALPNAVPDVQGWLLDRKLLIYPMLAAAVLVGKEFAGCSKSLTLTLNSLAVFASLAFYALWLFSLVPAFMCCVYTG